MLHEPTSSSDDKTLSIAIPDSWSKKLPLTLVIAVPVLSLTLLTVLVIAVCVRRGSSTEEAKTINNETTTSNGNIHVNPMMTSPYAMSFIGSVRAKSNPSTMDWMTSYNHLHMSPFQARKPVQWTNVQQPKEDNCYMEVNPIDENKNEKPEDNSEQWVEVTNKGNQTPSHWVYSDMISGNGELVYPLLAGSNQEFSTFNTYLADYSLPKTVGIDSAIHSASQSQPNSPMLKKQMRSASQPIKPLGQHLYQNVLRTTGSGTKLRSSPLVGTGPQKSFSVSNTPQLSVREIYQRAGGIGGDCDSGRESRLSSEIYARLPSEHVYFKINDGKVDVV